jgi:mono/diheme cytochrome c family protein
MATDVNSNDSPPESADVHGLHDPIVREKARPKDGFQPIPLALIFSFFALLMWGGWYIGEFDGNFAPDVFEPRGEVGAAAGPVEKAPADPMVLGKQLYTQCAACHQQTGQGVPGAFPPLDGSERVMGDPANFARILLHGLEGDVVVAGESYNGVMPAWKDRMSDEEIAAVMTYVRTAWSNEAPAVDPSVVADLREASGGRSVPWTDSELDSKVGE